MKDFISCLAAIVFITNAFAQNIIYYYENDTTRIPMEVIVTQCQKPNGKEIAVYKDDTNQIAYTRYYYRGYVNGVYTTYYKNGAMMEKIIYQKNKKNGEYTLYSPEGKVWVKGLYENDIKHGFWAYKTLNFYGKYKNGKKNGKWKLYYTKYSYYVYKYRDGNLVFEDKRLPKPPHTD